MDQIQLLLIRSRFHSRSPKVTGLYIGLGRLFLWDFFWRNKKSPVRDSPEKTSLVYFLSRSRSRSHKGGSFLKKVAKR